MNTVEEKNHKKRQTNVIKNAKKKLQNQQDSDTNNILADIDTDRIFNLDSLSKNFRTKFNTNLF